MAILLLLLFLSNNNNITYITSYTFLDICLLSSSVYCTVIVMGFGNMDSGC